MKQNEANWDRIARVALAIILFALYFGNVITGTLGIILLVLGVVLAVTGAVGFCPLYVLLKFSTKK